MMNNKKLFNGVRLVEELSQWQLDTLKEIVFWWGEICPVANLKNLNRTEQEIVKNALFESDITNKMIYKIFGDIYFTSKFFEKQQF